MEDCLTIGYSSEGGDTRKIVADYYIDDKDVPFHGLPFKPRLIMNVMRKSFGLPPVNGSKKATDEGAN